MLTCRNLRSELDSSRILVGVAGIHGEVLKLECMQGHGAWTGA